MEQKKKKNHPPKLIRFVMGYSVGFIAWLVGFHCLIVDSEGGVVISVQKLRKHLFKVFMWTLELGLLFNVMAIYRAWLLNATTQEIELAFIVKSVIFLYIKVFWPRVFPEILPGMHVFFCPQCYQKQTFRFMPVSFRLGFSVTYLCRYCSCLVNGWGEQIFYPVDVPIRKTTPSLMKTIPAVAVAMTLGVMVFSAVWGFLYN